MTEGSAPNTVSSSRHLSPPSSPGIQTDQRGVWCNFPLHNYPALIYPPMSTRYLTVVILVSYRMEKKAMRNGEWKTPGGMTVVIKVKPKKNNLRHTLFDPLNQS